MSQDELKPCPFCGFPQEPNGRAIVDANHDDWCPLNNIELVASFRNWNRRAPAPNVAQVVEDLSHLTYQTKYAGRAYVETTVQKEQVQKWLSLLRGKP